MSLIFATQLAATATRVTAPATQLTTAAANFYITCATVIPVLFLAVAVQGLPPQVPYQSVLRAWRAVDHAGEITLAPVLSAALAVFAGQDTGAAPPKRWKWVRLAVAAVAAVFLWVIASFLGLIALFIVLAGAVGEFMALYVLYQGSEQPGDRGLVLAATLVLGATVAADPVQAYIRRYLGSYVSRMKPAFAFSWLAIKQLPYFIGRGAGEADDAAEAEDQYAALLPVYEWVLGPERPDTLSIRANLAYWTGEAGDAAAARDRYAALLPVYERVLGPERPDTLTIRANLAYWTGEAGDAAAARDRYAALLPIRERVLGPEHPDTLSIRANLANWTGKAGDAAAARDRYAALLPIRERVLGAEHPDSLKARNNLAYWTKRAGI